MAYGQIVSVQGLCAPNWPWLCTHKDIIDAYHDALPLNRYGNESEIAEAISFLASDKASYITGQVLAADGGFEAQALVYQLYGNERVFPGS